jgi:hypothetical protein
LFRVGELVDEAKAEEDAANFDQPDCVPTTDPGCAISIKPDPERNNSLQGKLVLTHSKILLHL